MDDEIHIIANKAGHFVLEESFRRITLQSKESIYMSRYTGPKFKKSRRLGISLAVLVKN